MWGLRGLVLMCLNCRLDSRVLAPDAIKEVHLKEGRDHYVPICPLCGGAARLLTQDQAMVEDLIRDTSG
jgi:hypothetical protein